MDFDQRLAQGPLKVRALWNEELTEQLPARVLRLRRHRALARATAAISVVASVGLFAWWTNPNILRPSTAPAVASSPTRDTDIKAPREIVLTDGSRVELLRQDTNVVIRQDEESKVVATLSDGSAHFDVKPDAKRVFEVVAGRVRVRVLGTAFTVTRQGDRARVQVARGSVQVRWEGGESDLAAGEGGMYPPSSALLGTAGEAPPAEPEAIGAATQKTERDCRELARKGNYGEAYDAMRDKRAKGVRSDPADLMLAADVARLSRHPTEAATLLRRVTQEFPSDPRAPLAAFTLGRVLLENMGQPSGAAAAFSRAYRLAPGGPLAEDALAREVTARRQAGQHSAAKEVAKRYLTAYPGGRYADKFRTIAAAAD